ncbi:MAG: glycosyltransferase family 2 protein [Actinobacteria bacterium]|nr:glycosyltransferase family 2 protein [Actinomycetota bacterium]
MVLGSLPKTIDEVIVVDNNSSDKTKNTAREFGVKIFSETKNQNGIGYGFALQKGIKKAKGDIIICMDGDGSYPTEEIPTIVNHLLKKNLDFISCNRLPFKNPKKMSTVRTFGVKILNIFILALYGYKLQDCLSGMWVFKRNVFNDLDFTEGGWNFSLEVKLKTIISPYFKFVEFPISYKDRIFDQSKQNLFKTGLQHVFYLLKFKINLFKSILRLDYSFKSWLRNV